LIIEAVADDERWGGEIVISCRNGRSAELLGLLVEEVEKIGKAIGMSPESRSEFPGRDDAREEDEDEIDAPPLSFGDHPSAKGKWYVSYAWGDDTPEGIEREEKVSALCDEAATRGIAIVRDRDTLGNGDSIRRFMETLATGDRIIAILSEKYLHSANCMFEMYNAWQKQQANPDLFAGVVRTYRLPCAKMGDGLARGEIARFWREKAEKLAEYATDLGSRDLIDYQLTKHFALNVGDILYAINDTIIPRDWDAFLDWAFGE
jgi:internalin A